MPAMLVYTPEILEPWEVEAGVVEAKGSLWVTGDTVFKLAADLDTINRTSTHWFGWV